MKKTLNVLLITFIFCMSTSCGCDCELYDDTEILDRIENLEERMNETEALLSAMSKNLHIVSITENDAMYVLTFSDDTVISINKDATSSIVSIEQDNEFVYITMQNGSVLTFMKVPNTESNKIYYTSTDGKRVLPGIDTSSYGAVLITNYYNERDGGVMLFDDNVTKIGSFSSENLETITIPSTVTEITAYAFNRCRYLNTIYCNIKTPPTCGIDAFRYDTGLGSSYNINCHVYVPFESVDAYKKAKGWSSCWIEGYDFENN